MIDFLKSIKSIVKLQVVHTANSIFKLHNHTAVILIFFSLLLTSKQHFGDPIDCKVDVPEKSLVNTFCWTHGTYIILNTLDKKNGLMSGLGKQVPQISPHDQRFPSTRTNNSGFIVQKYYQWVCLFFCFQALLFYTPRFLWKSWEAGRMRLLVKDINGPLVPDCNWNTENKMKIVNYLICRKYAHNCYALRFALCEVLNLFNVCLQIFLTDWFLSGYFISYGVSLLTQTNINPMTLVFPKLAKCEYRFYGMSGTEMTIDAMCLLPLNVVNEKLFIFLWFWFLALVVLSFFQIMYRMCTMVSRTFREKILRARCRFLSQKTSDIIIDNFSYGDMFVLDLLARNINPILYKELVVDIATAIAERSNDRFDANATILV